MLAVASVNNVLMPTLSRLVENLERTRQAILRSIRSLVLIASPLSLGLSAVIEPLEELIWGGKWSAAVLPVQVLGLMLPFRLTFMVATSLLKAQAGFRRWAVLAMFQGLGLMLVAAAAGAGQLRPGEIAAAVTAYFLVVAPVTLHLSLKSLRLPIRELARALVPAWLMATGSAAVCIFFDHLLLEPLSPLWRIAVVAVLFVLLFIALVRRFLHRDICDTLAILPGPLSALGKRIFFLPE
jgi:O-antigen/teichoic acid export membrane protein